MNHKSRSGNTTISTGNTDTPIGLIIEFPYKKEGCANAEASLRRISLQFPYTHIGRALLAPAACVQAYICRALTLALTPPLKTPHLGYIGVHPPPPARGSSIMSDGEEQEPAVAAAEEYIMGEGGNLLIDVDEDEDAELLPVLNSIWECPKIVKCSGFDNNGTPFAG